MARDQEDFLAQASAALEKSKANESSIAERVGPPAIGDVYIFASTASLGIEWAIIMPHRDDPAFCFMVPFDQNPMVGTWDVAVSDSSNLGSGTLRCGRGIWVRTEGLMFGSRSGILEPWYAVQARTCLSAMFSADGNGRVSRLEVDDDPDYEEWLAEVTAAAELLESQFNEEPEAITLADFSPAWADAFQSHSYQASEMTMMVAESSGLAALPAPIETRSLGYVFPETLSGRLVAVLEGKVVRLRYFPTMYSPGPQINLLCDGILKPVTWRRLPDGVFESIDTISGASITLQLPCGTRKAISIGE